MSEPGETTTVYPHCRLRRHPAPRQSHQRARHARRDGARADEDLERLEAVRAEAHVRVERRLAPVIEDTRDERAGDDGGPAHEVVRRPDHTRLLRLVARAVAHGDRACRQEAAHLYRDQQDVRR